MGITFYSIYSDFTNIPATVSVNEDQTTQLTLITADVDGTPPYMFSLLPAHPTVPFEINSGIIFGSNVKVNVKCS